jgi:hypothetical protein
MGVEHSSNPSSLLNKEKEAEIVSHMMPAYFTNEKITSEEYEKTKISWNLILNNTAANYLLLKQDKSFESSSCISFFYDSFYLRLFELHPASRGLFTKGIKCQGTFLVQMISLALSEFNNAVKIRNTLIKLADVHNERGVKAIECEFIFKILFYLKGCIYSYCLITSISECRWSCW